MLAYVFWHHPAIDADEPAYRASLVQLHAHLRDASAVVESASFAILGAPWVNAAGAAYEDWYTVTDWPQLGALNDAATSGARKSPHDAAARAYAAGSGGVYALRAGDGAVTNTTHVVWIAKPRGMTYQDFDARLAPAIAEGAALWRRQMVLGPASEFCLTSRSPIALPPPLRGLAVERRTIMS